MLCGRIYSVLGRAQHKHCPGNAGKQAGRHASSQADKSKTIRMVAFNFLSTDSSQLSGPESKRGERENSASM